MRPRAERFHLMETALDEEIFGVVLGNDLLGNRAHAPVATCPVNHHEFAARFEHTLYFSEEAKAMLYLEKRVGKEDGVKRLRTQMSTSFLFDVAPHRINDVFMMVV